MAILEFYAEGVRPIVTHAQSAPQHQMGWSSHLPQPAIMLVGDQGVYLMSNGEPALKSKSKPDQTYVAFAQGINPYSDPDWYEAKRASFGGDDGAECLLIMGSVPAECRMTP